MISILEKLNKKIGKKIINSIMILFIGSTKDRDKIETKLHSSYEYKNLFNQTGISHIPYGIWNTQADNDFQEINECLNNTQSFKMETETFFNLVFSK